MNITQGLFIITGLAFAISMMVAGIIWLLSFYNSTKEDSLIRAEKRTLSGTLKTELRYFNRFQKIYRTYWYSNVVPTNELIAFYHEQ